MHRCLFVVAATLFAAHVGAQDLPKLKAGLWETTTTSSGPKGSHGSSSKHTMCVDDKAQKDMLAFTQNMGAQCAKNTVRRDGNKVYGEAECSMGKMTIKSHSVTTMSGDTAYRTEVKSSFTPPMAGMSESATVVEGRHVGACPANMKPGDINMNGSIMNINDMAKMMQGMKK